MNQFEQIYKDSAVRERFLGNYRLFRHLKEVTPFSVICQFGEFGDTSRQYLIKVADDFLSSPHLPA